MFQRATLETITRFVVGGSALLVATTFLLGGADRGIGAAIGGGFAIANWFAMRWLAQRLMVANPQGKMGLALLLCLKTGIALGAVTVILSTRLVDPIGFIVGFSGLVFGILVGGTVAVSAGGSGQAPSQSEES